MPQDFRIRLSPTRIDFSADVGLTGTDIDDYPGPGEQARYDHFRSVVLGLLAQQASSNEPTIRADGTPWLDLDDQVIKLYFDGAFHKYSKYIAVRGSDEDGGQLTLADWFADVAAFLGQFAPEVTFSGSCTADGVASIPIPESLRSALGGSPRCFLHVNGLLVDPRTCEIILAGSVPSSIRLIGFTLDNGDGYTVILRNITDNYFYSSSVNVP